MKAILKRIALFIFSFVIIATALAVLIPLFVGEPNFDVSMVSMAISGLLCITLVLLPGSLIQRSKIKRLAYVPFWLLLALACIIWVPCLLISIIIMIIFNKDYFDPFYNWCMDQLSDLNDVIDKFNK